MTSNPVKEEAVTEAMLRAGRIAWGGAGKERNLDAWLRQLYLAMRQADPRTAELEAALRHVRPLLVLRSGIPREERGQAIERIDAALNRKEG